ncbi:GSCOCG00002769001-RA-CDS [Cotesia congregata]|nr:GSCOCG00002769001-RA-CDS [Cotesia congregata]
MTMQSTKKLLKPLLTIAQLPSIYFYYTNTDFYYFLFSLFVSF